jgi:hypothetical protein
MAPSLNRVTFAAEEEVRHLDIQNEKHAAAPQVVTESLARVR